MDVRIIAVRGRDTRILLDGVNVAPAVKDYSVGQCPGEAPTLSLTLAPEILEFMGDEVDVDAFRQAVVKVPERVR